MKILNLKSELVCAPSDCPRIIDGEDATEEVSLVKSVHLVEVDADYREYSGIEKLNRHMDPDHMVCQDPQYLISDHCAPSADEDDMVDIYESIDHSVRYYVPRWWC